MVMITTTITITTKIAIVISNDNDNDNGPPHGTYIDLPNDNDNNSDNDNDNDNDIDYDIRNGNRTEWSPIRSVIIRVINKIGRPRSGSPIYLITSVITDRIGRHEVLLPLNPKFNKICDTIGYFLNQNIRNSKFCFASSEKKKSHLSTRVMARTVQLIRHDAYCPIKLSN